MVDFKVAESPVTGRRLILSAHKSHGHQPSSMGFSAARMCSGNSSEYAVLLSRVLDISESIAGTWEESYGLATGIVNQMTIDEKLGMVIGTGQLNTNRSYLSHF